MVITERRGDASLCSHITHELHAGALTEVHGGSIATADERFTQADGGHGPLWAFHLRAPLTEDALHGTDLDAFVVEGLVVHLRARIDAGAAESGGIDEGQEGRASGAQAIDGAVELAIAEITTADHGEHAAIFVVHDDGGTLKVFRLGPRRGGIDIATLQTGAVVTDDAAILLEGLVLVALVLLDSLEVLLHGLLRLALEVLIDAGVDSKTADGSTFLTHEAHHLRADGIKDVAEARITALRCGDHGLEFEFLCLIGGQRPLLHHAIEHMVTLLQRPLRMTEWIDVVRAFNETANRGRFLDGELTHIFAKVSPGGRLHAVEIQAEEDAVQIQLDDFRLRKVPFHTLRQEGLEDLALVALFHELEGLAGELLGDGGGSLGDLTRLKVQPNGTP